MSAVMTQQTAPEQVYAAGTVDSTTEDMAARTLRDVSDLFAAIKQLSRDEAEQLLQAVRDQADDLEVEMMGGLPVDAGMDTGREYYMQEAF